MSITLIVNGESHELPIDPNMPLLWAIRDHLRLTGSKFGCGMALCGACTMHVDGSAVRSCVLPASAAVGLHITTIEGLSTAAGQAVRDAWVSLDVPQCGYCQSGQIMSAASLLASNPTPSAADIDAAMSGNLCRCGTYARIRKAIQMAADVLRNTPANTADNQPSKEAGHALASAE